jgi:hypothetical protein
MRLNALPKLVLCAALPLLGQAPNANNSKSIKTFINCINDTFIAAQGATDIAMTVPACIPNQLCSMTGTSNESSAQKACELTIDKGLQTEKTIQFPRILLACPGTAANRQFMPSYVLCPSRQGGPIDSERIEVGEDTAVVNLADLKSRKMVMSDIHIPPAAAGRFQKIDPNTTYNLHVAANNFGSKRCNECHTVLNNKVAGTLALSSSISNFEEDDPSVDAGTEKDLGKRILFTDEPTPPKRGTPANPKTFQQVCDDIRNNKAKILDEAKKLNNALTAQSIDTISSLCDNLLARKKP